MSWLYILKSMFIIFLENFYDKEFFSKFAAFKSINLNNVCRNFRIVVKFVNILLDSSKIKGIICLIIKFLKTLLNWHILYSFLILIICICFLPLNINNVSLLWNIDLTKIRMCYICLCCVILLYLCKGVPHLLS